MGALDAWVVAVPPEKVLPAVVDFLPNPKASNEGKVSCSGPDMDLKDYWSFTISLFYE